MGRPPIGDQPMSGAERKRRHRLRQRQRLAELEQAHKTIPPTATVAAANVLLVNTRSITEDPVAIVRLIRKRFGAPVLTAIRAAIDKVLAETP
jgi:hypothetical protein